MEDVVKDALEKGVKNFNSTEYKKFMNEVQKKVGINKLMFIQIQTSNNRPIENCLEYCLIS